MAETGAAFGGEHSAHYYFRDNYRADSGSIAALVVLEQLCVTGLPLSELRKPYERYAASGEINTASTIPAAVIERGRRGDHASRSRTVSTASPSTWASGGSTCGRATPSRCCASTSRPGHAGARSPGTWQRSKPSWEAEDMALDPNFSTSSPARRTRARCCTSRARTASTTLGSSASTRSRTTSRSC